MNDPIQDGLGSGIGSVLPARGAKAPRSQGHPQRTLRTAAAHSSSRLRSIQAVFSCTSSRCVSTSAVGWSFALLCLGLVLGGLLAGGLGPSVGSALPLSTLQLQSIPAILLLLLGALLIA